MNIFSIFLAMDQIGGDGAGNHYGQRIYGNQINLYDLSHTH